MIPLSGLYTCSTLDSRLIRRLVEECLNIFDFSRLEPDMPHVLQQYVLEYHWFCVSDYTEVRALMTMVLCRRRGLDSCI